MHHAGSHCYGAFYGSRSKGCIVISLDGNGDGVSGRVDKITNGKFSLNNTFGTNESLGNFYTSCTNHLGFKSVEGEYKVMAMPTYADQEQEEARQYLDF